MKNGIACKLLQISELFDEQKYEKLLCVVDELLKIDPNNSEFLNVKLKAKVGLGIELDDIGFLRKLCWYRSSSAEAFWQLARAYLARNDVNNALVACAYCLSVDSNFSVAKIFLEDTLSKLKCTKLKIAFLTVSRLGHLVIEPDSWFRKQQCVAQKEDSLFLFVSEGNPANLAVYEKVKSQLTVVENAYWIKVFKSRSALLSDEFYELMPFDLNSNLRGLYHGFNKYREFNRLFDNTDPLFNYSSLSDSERFSYLAKLGITPQDKVVCVHVRDSGYLTDKVSIDTSYHDHRDSDINHYELTISYLISEGYKVVRLGKITNQYSQCLSENYVDLHNFVNLENRDLVDIVLLEFCDFLIASPCGVADLAASLDTPLLMVNSAPFCPSYHGKTRIVPKIVMCDNSQPCHFLSLFNGEITLDDGELVHMCLNGHKLSSNGFHMRDCEPEEILEAVKEFMDLVEVGVFNSPTLMQQKFADLLPEDIWFKNFNSWVTNNFLKKYQSLFFRDLEE